MKTKKEIEARIKLFMSNIRKGLSYDANEVMLVDDIYKAITATPCCKSDSQPFKCRNVSCNKMTDRSNGTVFCEEHKPYLGI